MYAPPWASGSDWELERDLEELERRRKEERERKDAVFGGLWVAVKIVGVVLALVTPAVVLLVSGVMLADRDYPWIGWPLHALGWLYFVTTAVAAGVIFLRLEDINHRKNRGW